MKLLAVLDRFFTTEAPLAPSDRILVAFSGGPDSTALLLGLRELSRRRGFDVRAAHLDHALDPDSSRRADAAALLCSRLGVPLIRGRRAAGAKTARSHGREAAARRDRYRFLEQARRRLEARYIATAHHRDDQIETVLLRLLFGSGLEGLAGVRPRRGQIVRPLLEISRRELKTRLRAWGVEAVEDPTNEDLRVPRNLVRRLLLPRLTAEDPEVRGRLERLARAAAAASATIAARLEPRLGIVRQDGSVLIERAALLTLPEALWPFALSLLHRGVGSHHPPGGAARAELRRQLLAGGRVGCDCADGWRWESAGVMLRLARPPAPVPLFSYTLQVPGELEVPELSLIVKVARRPVAPWMLRGSPVRAGLALPVKPGDEVTVRNRRPGDRIRPLGCPFQRRLKELLIDRRVPRGERDRLPLLCLGERVAWVPGVTIDEAFRLREAATAWVVEIEQR